MLAAADLTQLSAIGLGLILRLLGIGRVLRTFLCSTRSHNMRCVNALAGSAQPSVSLSVRWSSRDSVLVLHCDCPFAKLPQLKWFL